MTSVSATVIIAVGDELLGGFTQDTNSQWLAEQVRDAGFPALRMEVVGDDLAAIAAAIARALAEPAVTRVLVSGGLGPTPDDRTADGVARALERPMHVDETALRHITGIVARMHAAGWVPSPVVSDANRKMAIIPAGAQVLENRRGMAPVLAYDVTATAGVISDARAGGARAIDGEPRWLIVLPGVPRELRTVVAEEVLPRYFAGRRPAAVAERRYEGVVEADLSAAMRGVEQEFPDVAVGSYPQPDRRILIVRARGADAERVAAALRRLEALRSGAG